MSGQNLSLDLKDSKELDAAFTSALHLIATQSAPDCWHQIAKRSVITRLRYALRKFSSASSTFNKAELKNSALDNSGLFRWTI
jgi:hypothetical protein